MKNLRRIFERFCLRNRNKGIRNLMLYICIGNAVVYLLSMFAQNFERDTRLASSVVSVFTALSVLTIPPVVGLAQHLMG